MKKTLFMLLALFAVTTAYAQQNEKKAKIEFVERTVDLGPLPVCIQEYRRCQPIHTPGNTNLFMYKQQIPYTCHCSG